MELSRLTSEPAQMPRSVTIHSLPVAFEMTKAMQADGLGWGEGCRPLARQAFASIIEDNLAASIDAHLLHVAERGAADWRNGSYRRTILTELGDIEFGVRARGPGAPSRWCAPMPGARPGSTA